MKFLYMSHYGTGEPEKGYPVRLWNAEWVGQFEIIEWDDFQAFCRVAAKVGISVEMCKEDYEQ